MAITCARMHTFALVATAVGCTVIFSYTATKYVQYSPLYVPLECTQTPGPGTDPAFADGFLRWNSSSVKTCVNPNNYDLEVHNPEPGTIYVLGENLTLTAIGEVTVPDAKYPASSNGSVASYSTLAVPLGQAGPLLDHPILQFVSVVPLDSRGQLSFFGLSLGSWESKKEFCGSELRRKPEPRMAGPMACAKTLEELEIPPFDTPHEVEVLEMEPAVLNEKSKHKDMMFGLLMAVSAVLLLWSGPLSIRRICCKKDESARKLEVDEAKEESKV